jgi:multimeric flavodoxin WrbA
MMKVTAIMGSPRRRGFTYLATRRFLDNLAGFGDVQSEIVFLSDFAVEPCKGCKTCFLRGEEFCPLKDDRDMLIRKMLDSDGVLFATPNYSFQVSGRMKLFLDRLGFVFHRPCFHGKVFTSIVAQGIYGGGNVVKYLNFVGSGLGFNVVKGNCITALEPMSTKERIKMEKSIDAQSGRFHERILQPGPAVPSLFQLMGFRMGRTSVRLTLSEEKRDYTYYRDHGWFNSDYFYPTHLNPMKKAAGAAFDWTAGRIFANRRDACV